MLIKNLILIIFISLEKIFSRNNSIFLTERMATLTAVSFNTFIQFKFLYLKLYLREILYSKKPEKNQKTKKKL